LQTMFPEARSSASSPNLPIELQSPAMGNDPWYQVAQSKTAAGLEEMGEFNSGTAERTDGGGRSGQLAVWNDISKELRDGKRQKMLSAWEPGVWDDGA
jgi:hypothetical protein